MYVYSIQCLDVHVYVHMYCNSHFNEDGSKGQHSSEHHDGPRLHEPDTGKEQDVQYMYNHVHAHVYRAWKVNMHLHKNPIKYMYTYMYLFNVLVLPSLFPPSLLLSSLSLSLPAHHFFSGIGRGTVFTLHGLSG